MIFTSDALSDVRDKFGAALADLTRSIGDIEAVEYAAALGAIPPNFIKLCALLLSFRIIVLVMNLKLCTMWVVLSSL